MNADVVIALAVLLFGWSVVSGRLERLDVTGPIVFVAAASTHRRAAFEAADYMMDRLKTDAVFWKREDSVDSSSWIEPTEMDRAERARWSE